MSARTDAEVYFDPNTGRLNVTMAGDPSRPQGDQVKTVIVRFEYGSGGSAEHIIRAPKEQS